MRDHVFKLTNDEQAALELWDEFGVQYSNSIVALGIALGYRRLDGGNGFHTLLKKAKEKKRCMDLWDINQRHKGVSSLSKAKGKSRMKGTK